MLVLERILAIPDDQPDFYQMGLSTHNRGVLRARGYKRTDGTEAKDRFIKADKKLEAREKAVIKGDRQLSDKELKQVQYEKKEAFRDRVSKLMYAPVGVAPTEAKALKIIKSMDEGELAKYESRASGKESRRYTVGVEKAKKRINDLQNQINSLSENVATQEQAIRKAQSAKADRAGRNAVKKIGKDNPYGLEADGIGSPWTKSAQKIRGMEGDLGKSTQELEKLKAKRRKLQSVWGDRIAVKERKDAQAPSKIAPDTAKKIKGAIATSATPKSRKVVKGMSPRDRGASKTPKPTTIQATVEVKKISYPKDAGGYNSAGEKKARKEAQETAKKLSKDGNIYVVAYSRGKNNESPNQMSSYSVHRGYFRGAEWGSFVNGKELSAIESIAEAASKTYAKDFPKSNPKLKQPSAAQKMNMTDAEYAAFKKKVKRL
jgi:hypothetical protein